MTLPYRSESAPHTGLEQSMKSWSGIWSINRFQSMHICSLLSICIGQSMNNRWHVVVIYVYRLPSIGDEISMLSNWSISNDFRWLLIIEKLCYLIDWFQSIFNDYWQSMRITNCRNFCINCSLIININQLIVINCHWFSLISNFIDCPGPTHNTSGFCPRQIILRHCCLLG